MGDELKRDLARANDQFSLVDALGVPTDDRVTTASVQVSPPATAGAIAPQQAPQLRVAYLINQYPKVSHTFIRRELLALERLGVEVTRIALRGWDAEVADDEDRAERSRTSYVLKTGLLPLLGAALRTAVARPGRFLAGLKAAIAMSRSSMRPLPYHLVYLAHACYMLPMLEKRQVRHLHAHFGTNTAEVAMLARLLGGPEYSFTVHGPEEIDDARHMGFDRTVPAAKFIVAISSYTRSQLQRHVPYEHWDKIKVVHCGIDEQFFAGATPELADTRQLVCVGRLSAQKGQLDLLDAFSRVVQKHPDCRLVLAGDGEMRPVLEGRIRKLGIENSVRITGWISGAQVRNEILASRALVLPSLQEGLPVVIMEAMALRRPVISTYIAGIPELVIPGESGWLIPSGNMPELVRAIEACLETPVEALRQMGIAASRRALDRHSIDRETAMLATLFAAPPQGVGVEQGDTEWQR
jgi:colanic acid/amylovoran biosynthesis glycosyltransferase